MSDPNQRRVRAVSARPPNMRPQSGKNRKLHQKTEFIENVYQSNPGMTPGQLTSYNKNKMFSMRSNFPESEQNDFSKLLPKGDRITKDR